MRMHPSPTTLSYTVGYMSLFELNLLTCLNPVCLEVVTRNKVRADLQLSEALQLQPGGIDWTGKLVVDCSAAREGTGSKVWPPFKTDPRASKAVLKKA